MEDDTLITLVNFGGNDIGPVREKYIFRIDGIDAFGCKLIWVGNKSTILSNTCAYIIRDFRSPSAAGSNDDSQFFIPGCDFVMLQGLSEIAFSNKSVFSENPAFEKAFLDA